MFVLSTHDNAAYRAIAMLLALALVLMGYGAHVSSVQAANLTDIKDTLSDSNPSSPSNHTIEFVVPAGSTGIDADAETITVTFPATFATTGIDMLDVDLAIDGVDETIASTSAAGVWGFSVSGNDLIFEADAATPIAALATVTIQIGTNATTGGTGNSQMINPAATTTSYEILVTMPDDTGRTRVAIEENVLVTAVVDTSFDFVISGFSSAGTNINGTTTTGTTSAIALPFGTVSSGQTYRLAQQLNVTTNAINGFVVTVEQDQNLLSSTGADIDGFDDGTYQNTPILWTTPSNTLLNENHWGHWGLTSDDSDLNGGEFNIAGDAAWVSASTTPRDIFSHTGPSDGTTDDIGSTTVAYALQITDLQEAADDYSTTLTYIATPTF